MNSASRILKVFTLKMKMVLKHYFLTVIAKMNGFCKTVDVKQND